MVSSSLLEEIPLTSITAKRSQIRHRLRDIKRIVDRFVYMDPVEARRANLLDMNTKIETLIPICTQCAADPVGVDIGEISLEIPPIEAAEEAKALSVGVLYLQNPAQCLVDSKRLMAGVSCGLVIEAIGTLFTNVLDDTIAGRQRQNDIDWCRKVFAKLLLAQVIKGTLRGLVSGADLVASQWTPPAGPTYHQIR